MFGMLKSLDIIRWILQFLLQKFINLLKNSTSIAGGRSTAAKIRLSKILFTFTQKLSQSSICSRRVTVTSVLKITVTLHHVSAYLFYIFGNFEEWFRYQYLLHDAVFWSAQEWVMCKQYVSNVLSSSIILSTMLRALMLRRRKVLLCREGIGHECT